MSVRIEVQIVSDCQINEDLLFVLAPIFLKKWIDPEIKNVTVFSMSKFINK